MAQLILGLALILSISLNLMQEKKLEELQGQHLDE